MIRPSFSSALLLFQHFVSLLTELGPQEIKSNSSHAFWNANQSNAPRTINLQSSVSSLQKSDTRVSVGFKKKKRKKGTSFGSFLERRARTTKELEKGLSSAKAQVGQMETQRKNDDDLGRDRICGFYEAERALLVGYVKKKKMSSEFELCLLMLESNVEQSSNLKRWFSGKDNSCVATQYYLFT
uniref:Uncharacterized protein n=1 Tax=Caenorhabditis japonica TaxID=281687 RepID=A0A8R1EGF0_CAEJA